MGIIGKAISSVKSLFGLGKKPKPQMPVIPPAPAPLVGAELAKELNKETAPLTGAALAEELHKKSPAVSPAPKAKKPVAKKNKKKE